MLYNFLPIKADLNKNLFVNQEYLDDLINLFLENKDTLINDYWHYSDYLIIDRLINEINTGNYLVILCDGKFMGFCCLQRWEGGLGKYHSVQLQGCIKKEFQGKQTEQAFSQLINNLFYDLGLSIIEMEIPEDNKPACFLASRMGFEYTGKRLNATTYKNKPVNYKIYSISKEEINDINKLKG